MVLAVAINIDVVVVVVEEVEVAAVDCLERNYIGHSVPWCLQWH